MISQCFENFYEIWITKCDIHENYSTINVLFTICGKKTLTIFSIFRLQDLFDCTVFVFFSSDNHKLILLHNEKKKKNEKFNVNALIFFLLMLLFFSLFGVEFFFLTICTIQTFKPIE